MDLGVLQRVGAILSAVSTLVHSQEQAQCDEAEQLPEDEIRDNDLDKKTNRRVLNTSKVVPF